MSTFFQDNADATKKIALDVSTISTGTTRTITMPDRDVDLNDPQNTALPHGFSAPQSYTPHTMVTPGVVEAAKSQYQKFTATTDTVLSFDATPTPGTPFTVEVDPAGFVIDVPAAWNGFGRYSQASTTNKFLIELYVRSDSSIEILRSTAAGSSGGGGGGALPGAGLDWQVPTNNTLVEWQTAISDTVTANTPAPGIQLVSVFPQRGRRWTYAVYGGNGKIYNMGTNSEIGIVDCTTYESSLIGTANTSRALKLLLAGDGNIYGIQRAGTQMIKIDTTTDTAVDVTPLGAAPTSSVNWTQGFRSLTGELYFLDAKASQVYKYDHVTNTGTLLTGTGYSAGTAATAQVGGAQLSTDGFAYIAPYGGTTMQKYDPSTDTCTTLPTYAAMGATSGTTNILTEGICLTKDAEIFVPPGALQAEAKVVNTSTLSCTSLTNVEVGTSFASNNNYASSSCLGACGRCFYAFHMGANFDDPGATVGVDTSTGTMTITASTGELVDRVINGPGGKLFFFQDDIATVGQVNAFGGVIDTGTAGWSDAVLKSPFISG